MKHQLSEQAIAEWQELSRNELMPYSEGRAHTDQLMEMIGLGLLTMNSQYGRQIRGRKPLDTHLYEQMLKLA